MSERRASTVVGLHRSTMRRAPPAMSTKEVELRAWLRTFSIDRPRWGWRRAATMARRAGWTVSTHVPPMPAGPMLLTAGTPQIGEGWLIEPKLDGTRSTDQ